MISGWLILEGGGLGGDGLLGLIREGAGLGDVKVLVAANKSAKLTATGWRVTTTVWFEKSEVA